MIRIRQFRPDDAAALRVIFEQAVLQGSAGFYDEVQRKAWAEAPNASPAWTTRLGDQITVVAERDGGLAGFMTLGHDGHLDLAFVRPDCMGTGLAASLHDRLLAIAMEKGLSRLTTEASHLARRFFLKQGWVEQAEQTVWIGDVQLTNFRMEKPVGSLAGTSETP